VAPEIRQVERIFPAERAMCGRSAVRSDEGSARRQRRPGRGL